MSASCMTPVIFVSVMASTLIITVGRLFITDDNRADKSPSPLFLPKDPDRSFHELQWSIYLSTLHFLAHRQQHTSLLKRKQLSMAHLLPPFLFLQLDCF